MIRILDFLDTIYHIASWWRHQMETFSALLAIFVWGIPRTKASVVELLIFSLICAWINGWVNNGGAGDLRLHRAHNDVPVILRLVFGFYAAFRTHIYLKNQIH